MSTHLKGVGGAPGIVLGRAFCYRAEELAGPAGDESPDAALARFAAAQAAAVARLNAVAEMDQLDQIKSAMSQVMGFVEFTDGHRYADFVPGSDKVAEYGIAALIAGGVAAKAGLFKVLLAALIGLKKLLVVALAAVAAFFRKLMGRKKAGGVGATPPA